MRSDLDFHASGFVVRHDGELDEAELPRFQRFVTARGLSPTADELSGALAGAVERYRGGDALHVCGAKPCAGSFGFDPTDRALSQLTERVGMPAVRTGCQGHCKQRPVMSIRIGNHREMFGRMTTEDDRRSVIDYAKSARDLRSFLVPGTSADAFRFDLEHGDFEPTARLRPLHFLLGRFQGEGRYAQGDYTFTKEVVGSYEAGGRFMTLRMEARYPTNDGGTDMHRALVVVGFAANSDQLDGRAFTDGGEIHDYAVKRRADCLEFEDQSPDHGTPWKRVRKTLRPTRDGYDECLDVDRGAGLEPYCRVAMRRAGSLAHA